MLSDDGDRAQARLHRGDVGHVGGTTPDATRDTTAAQDDERWRLLVDNLPESAVYQYVHEPDGAVRFLYVSAGIERLNGVSVADVLRDAGTLHGQIPPEYFEQLVEAEARSKRELCDFHMELPMRRPGGEVRWMRLHSRPRRLADGRTAWDGVQTDVTERKQAEAALRESKESLNRFNAELEREVASRTRELSESREAVKAERQRFLDMLDTLPVVIDIIRADHHIEWTNRAYRDALGDNTGKRCYASQFGLDAPCVECQAFTPLETGRPHRWEWTLPNGRTFDIHNFPFAAADGSRAILEMDIDVTEQRQAAAVLKDVNAALEHRVAERTAALQESEERFRVAQDLSPDGFLIFRPLRDETGAVTDFLWLYENGAAARMNDTNPREVCGKRVSEVLPHHHVSPFHKAYKEVAETGEVRVVEEAFYDEDTFQQRRWFRAVAVPTTDGDVAILVQNVTERKRAEEALRDAVARLAEADRRKDEFIAVLSHELRNPLAPIRYALPLLGEECLGAAGRRATEVIDRQVTHLSRLVDDLLDVSRITAGKIELRRDHVAVSSVVRTAVEAASPAIAAGGHSLDISVPEAPIWLHVDAARISQAITNLLNNSAKYTPQGGRIRLEATADEGTATIRVIDNGIGLAPEALTAVFEMFRQAGDRNRAEGGLGVGLTLAKQLVEMHEGAIEAHSEGEGRGAEFVIRLPLAVAAAPTNEQQTPVSGGHPARLRVLVVDDNVDLVDMLALVVEAAGHEVRKAFDGRTAISAALEYQPHLILLDLGMPDMNGVEVATQMRRHAELAGTRIIALTGWGQAEDRRRTVDAGFDDHLTKPADPRQIQRILDETPRRMAGAADADSARNPDVQDVGAVGDRGKYESVAERPHRESKR